MDTNSSDLGLMLSSKIKSSQELFTLTDEGWLRHFGTNIFYDPQNGIVGYFIDVDEFEVDEEEFSLKQQPIGFVNVSAGDIKLIHMAYIEWVGWYKSQANQKIIDMAKDSF